MNVGGIEFTDTQCVGCGKPLSVPAIVLQNSEADDWPTCAACLVGGEVNARKLLGRGRDEVPASRRCDKCGEPVAATNSMVAVMVTAAAMVQDAKAILHYSLAGMDRHFLPEGDCPGSPSRAQYIEGQPRDDRGYAYHESIEGLIRMAYREVSTGERD